MSQAIIIKSKPNHNILKVILYAVGGLLPIAANAAKLGETPGLNALQAATGTAVQTVCVGLIPTNTITDNPQTPEQDLFNQCGAMVHTGNEIQGSGKTGNSLGLSSAELGSALQNVATEEMGTPSRVAMGSLSGQVAKINIHLSELHKISQGLGGGSGDDSGALLDNRLNVFVNAIGGVGEIDASVRENAADFYSAGFLVGVDYRFTRHFVAGVAGAYSYLGADFQNNINVSGGGIKADTFNLSLFASYDVNDFYIDGNFTYGRTDYDVERGVVVLSHNTSSTGGANRVATADTNGNQFSVGSGFGYNFHAKALNIRPYARLDYYHGQVDAYNESGAFGLNLSVAEQKFDSFQSQLGTQLSYVFSPSFGVIIPQFNVAWHHEFLNNSREINARYTADINNFTLTTVTDGADRDFATLGVGVSSVLAQGIQLFLNYQTLLGYRSVTSHSFSTGVRLEF
jgi:outer membrane autotransporter protein